MNLFRNLFYQIQYLFNPPWDTGITPPELEAFVADHPPGRALDLGCGTGTNVIYLAQHGWKVTGVDFIGKAIRKAVHKAQQAGVEARFLTEDVTRLKGVSGKFDLILDIGCFHSLPVESRRAYLKNLCRLLDPQGTYLLYAFVRLEDNSSPGLDSRDLQALEERLELVERQQGTDRGHISAWFAWQKPIDPTPVQ
jgi:SAM-dependent methyltransferase